MEITRKKNLQRDCSHIEFRAREWAHRDLNDQLILLKVWEIGVIARRNQLKDYKKTRNQSNNIIIHNRV